MKTPAMHLIDHFYNHASEGEYHRAVTSTYTIEMYAITATCVRLLYLWVPEQRKGHGTAFIQQLAHEADRLGVNLRVSADPFGEDPMPLRKLKAWYSLFGFVADGTKEMVRYPTGHTYITATKPPARPVGLTAAERDEWTDIQMRLSGDVFVNQITEEDKQALYARISFYRDKIQIISIAQYFALARENRPRFLRHLPDAGFAANKRVLSISADYWTRTEDERSWCNHGGIELEIISEEEYKNVQ